MGFSPDFLKAESANLVKVVGSFRPNGAGAVLDVRGSGFTVARTGVGVFTVTLTKPKTQSEYEGAIVTPGFATGAVIANLGVSAGTFTAATFGPPATLATLTILAYLVSTGAASDTYIAGNDNRIQFEITFRTSPLRV